MAKRSRLGQKQCPECQVWVKGTRTKECPKCSHQFNGKKKAAPAPKAPAPKPALEPAPVVAEKPAKVADADHHLPGESRSRVGRISWRL